jgi:hypothetical protein
MPTELKYVDPNRPRRVFAPYATYRREAAQAQRTIPIVQLSARGSDNTA